jgi:Tol biopolymer transport system component
VPPSFVTDGSTYYFAFTPSGDKVTYVNYEEEPQICASKVDGSEKTCFPFSDGQQKISASNLHWSPDGQWLLYDMSYFDSGLGSINKTRPDGSELTHLTAPDTGYNSRSAWSPDGTQVAYAQVTGAPNMESAYHQPANLWVVGADGSNPQMIFEGMSPGSLPLAWSPDGKWIAVDTADKQLWLVSPDGKEKQMLAGAVENASLGYLMWSPTATGWPLLYRLTKENDVRELHYIAAPGESPQMLLNDIYWGPYWSGDATMMFIGQRVTLDKEKQLYLSTFYVVQSYPNLLP